MLVTKHLYLQQLGLAQQILNALQNLMSVALQITIAKTSLKKDRMAMIANFLEGIARYYLHSRLTSSVYLHFIGNLNCIEVEFEFKVDHFARNFSVDQFGQRSLIGQKV